MKGLMSESPELKKENREIQFKALTDGLGFHPFANGLPYAPTQSKTPAPMPAPNARSGSAARDTFSDGSGAYSAGRPVFVTPRVSTPAPVVARPQNLQPSPQVQASLRHNLQDNLQAPLHVEHHNGVEYLAKRFLAYFLDSFINISMSGAVLGFCLWDQSGSFDFMLNAGVLFVSISFLLFFNWALITAQEVLFHTSIGKKFFGLRINGSLTAILARAILFIPSFVFFAFGVLWALVDTEHLAAYDRASGIHPREVAEL
jgi:hypothetical protein